MERKDFSVIANSRGYQIQYKGQNIGGAGISGEAKSPRGRAARKQIDDYLRYGQSGIEAILGGYGETRFSKIIAQIDSEEL